MNSFISWIGGKKFLRKKIISQFPENYGRYIEVFGGAGWVMFGIEQPAPLEVFNDKNSDLINLYRCVKYHCDELQRELHFILNSREQFKDFKQQIVVGGLTDIQRAARYFILIKHSFGSDIRSFATDKSNHVKMIDYMGEISKRLERTVIENIDFEQLISTYDRPDALFYLDPPYHKTERYYSEKFTPDDHVRLRDTLGSISGKFLLSYNNDDFIKDLYRDYHITEFSRANNLTNAPRKDAFKEIIIKNY